MKPTNLNGYPGIKKEIIRIFASGLVLCIFAAMTLPLRITFEDNDYTYIVLTKLIDRDTKEIKILLGEQELTLFKNEHNVWDARERAIEDKGGLIKAIARNVALRYRL